MCGLTGFLAAHASATPRDSDRVLIRMAGALQHRGPDSAGVWHDSAAGVGLGHCRLAIIDPSFEGHQPMRSADGRYVLVFNGEIYNFLELRRELEELGHGLRGRSDTEVVVTSVASWGLDTALSRFCGMFALALWDRDQRVLHLARDRLGKKPLYLALHRGVLLFASELKSLHTFPGFAPDLDRGALTLYLRHGYVPDPFCVYEHTAKLPPGTCVTLGSADLNGVDTNDLLQKTHVYWSLRDVVHDGKRSPLHICDRGAVDALDRLLRQVVAERMIADVPVGAFLSGGIDSSIVVALMQAQTGPSVRTFSIGFEAEEFDEAPHAKEVAYALGTDHTELYVTAADALSVVPMLPEIYDEPFADSSQIPTFLISRMARRDVTVALTGDGGDESFGGYQRYIEARRRAILCLLPRQLRRAASRCLTAIAPRGWDQALAACRPLLPEGLSRSISGERIYNLASILELTNATDMYRRAVSMSQTPAEIVIGGHEPLTPLSIPDWRDEGIGDFLSWMMCVDTVAYLPGDILVKVDRASMATSLEVRSPLLDHRLVEFAWRLPAPMKIRSGRGKWILRQVLARYVQPALFERSKQGFAVPIAMWLRGPLREWAEELLDETGLRRDGFFYPRLIRQAWSEHLDGVFDRSGLLWNVLMFQAWRKRWHTPGQ